MSVYKIPTLAEHYRSLKFCPLSKEGRGQINQNQFYWEFDMKPSTFSKIYTIHIVWKKSEIYPNIFVLNQEVKEVSKTRTIPHLYDHKKIELCLFYPSYNQFNKSMSLSKTIIPWIKLWLIYYEYWLFSDEWKGGGIHPNLDKIS